MSCDNIQHVILQLVKPILVDQFHPPLIFILHLKWTVTIKYLIWNLYYLFMTDGEISNFIDDILKYGKVADNVFIYDYI